MPSDNELFLQQSPSAKYFSHLRSLERNAKMRYVPLALEYHIFQAGLTPLYEYPVRTVLPSGYSFRGVIYVQGTCLKVSTQASASITWRPGGALVTFSLEATLCKEEAVIDRKFFDFTSPAIHNPLEYGLTRVNWVEFELPEPSSALRLDLKGKCALNENHGAMDISWGFSATGSYGIFLEFI